MCGRYYVDDETAREIEKIVRDVNDKLYREHKRTQRKAGDIFPTNTAPVIVAQDELLEEKEQVWGYPGFNHKGVVFNARSETAAEKRMFAESVKNRRVIIPAAGFYEWNKQKDKFRFTAENDRVLLLAGCYQKFNDTERFVILTTEANESMKDVHSRMPVIIKRDEIAQWMFEDEAVEFILHRTPPQLNREVEGQMTLFD